MESAGVWSRNRLRQLIEITLPVADAPTGHLAARVLAPSVGVENLVFSELAKTIHPLLDALRFWRSKAGAEVDFVVEHEGRVLPVEVKASAGRLLVTRSMRSFIEAYRPADFLVAAMGEPAASMVGRTRICQVPVHRLAAEVRDWLEKS